MRPALMEAIPDWAREFEAASETREAALQARLDKIQAELDAERADAAKRDVAVKARLEACEAVRTQIRIAP